jgi:hypothetical protein
MTINNQQKNIKTGKKRGIKTNDYIINYNNNTGINFKIISDRNMLYSILFILVSIIPFVYFINNYAYDKSGKLVCSNYVLNTYLYTALGFCYIALGVILEQKMQLLPKLFKHIISLIVFMILYFIIMLSLFRAIRYTDPNNFIEINTYYFLLCLLFGIVLSITLVFGASLNLLYPAIFITIILTIIMGFIGYNYGQHFISINFDKYLMYSLWILIGWSLIAPIFIYDYYTLTLAISIPSIIIFCLLLMSYNNQIRKNSEKCIIPNYPNEATGLVLKIANILADVIKILSTRRIKST